MEDLHFMDLNILEIAKASGGTLTLQGADGSQSGNSQAGSSKAGDDKVSGVVIDSRLVTAKSVFLATVGERVDGHKFIGDVFARGASLVITEKTPEQVEAEHGVPADSWGNYLLVKDSLQALKEIAEYYRSKLTIPVVGITGSVGKTSTKEFIAGVLSGKYQVLKTEGNFNNEIGVPLTLLRIRPQHEAAVVEMGISDFGEMHRLSKMARPTICVITNIGQCHLENLKTRDGILKAKTEIFDFMEKDGEVCLNGEDDKLRTVTEVNGKKTHFFGLGADCEEVYADSVQGKGLWGSDAVLHLKNVQDNVRDGAQDSTQGTTDIMTPIHVPLPGAHMVINAAAAACVARILGLTAAQIAEGIQKVSAIGGRNNLIRLPHYTLIDDCYNANPVSMKAALDLLAMADTEKIAILGDMFELGGNSDALHAETGAYAVQRGIDRIYCVGENSRHMYEGAMQAAGGEQNADCKSVREIRHYRTREELLADLAKDRAALIPEGCTTLLKASHGMAFTEVLEELKK